MGLYDGVFGEDSPAAGGMFDEVFNDQPKPKSSSLIRRAADIPIGLAKGVVDLPGAAVGLLDIPTNGYASKAVDAVANPLGEVADSVNLPKWARPTQWSDELAGMYSPEIKQAKENVHSAFVQGEQNAADEGAGTFGKFIGAAKEGIPAIINNPSAALALATENYGGMKAIAKGTAKALAPAVAKYGAAVKAGTMTQEAADAALANLAGKYAATGEGLLTAGQGVRQVQQENPDETFGDRAMQGVAGAITGGISRGVSKIPGLGDVEANMALRDVGSMAKTGLSGGRLAAGAKGVLSEGLLEEFPQSIQEQIWQNLATNKPWNEGLAEQGISGLVAGGGMGGAMGLVNGGSRPSAQDVQASPEEQPITGLLSAPVSLGTPSAQTMQADVERANAVDAAQQNTDAVYAERAAFETERAKLRQGGPLSRSVDAGLDSGATTPLALGYNANVRADGAPLYTYPDGSTLTQSEFDQRQAQEEQSRLDGMVQDNLLYRMMEQARERFPEAQSQQELANLILAEKANVDNRRAEISNSVSANRNERSQAALESDAAQDELAPKPASVIERMMQSRTDDQLSSISAQGSNPSLRQAAIVEMQRRMATPSQPTTAAPQIQKSTQLTLPERVRAAKSSQIAETTQATNDAQAGAKSGAAQGSKGVASGVRRGVPISTLQQERKTVADGATPIKVNTTLGSQHPDYEAKYSTPTIEAARQGNAKVVTLKSGREVNLVIGEDEYGDEGVVSAVSNDGEIVGSLYFIKSAEGFNPDVHVEDGWRRDGVATAMYDLAEATGGKIPAVDGKTGQLRTEDGQAFRMARAGKKQAAAPEAKQDKAPVSTNQYSDENRKALYLDMKAKLMRGEITLQEGQREMSKFDEDAEAAKEEANSATAKAKKATPEDKGDVRYSKASLKSANVRGMADKDTVAGTQAPTSAGDGSTGSATIEVDGAIRPTLNSNGKPIHPTAEGIRNFWRWFGGSKVVDSEGRPIVVFHGSDNDIQSFNPLMLGKNTGAASAKKGFFFAAHPRTTYAYMENGVSGTEAIFAAAYGWTFKTYSENVKKWQQEEGRPAWDKDVPFDWLVSNSDVASLRNSYKNRLRDLNKKSGGLMRRTPLSKEELAEKERIEDWLDDDQALIRMAQNSSITNDFGDMSAEEVDSYINEHLGWKMAGANIMPVYLKIESPAEFDDGDQGYREQSYSERIDIAANNKNDGLIIRNTADGFKSTDTVFVVFDPKNIKSASGNVGVFGSNAKPNEPSASAGSGADIRRSESSDSSAGIPISRNNAEKRIKALLGDKAGKALIESGIISIANNGSEYKGATYGNGNVVLNLDALTYDNFDGVLAHEGLHSTLRELVGDQTYSKLLNQLDAMVKLGKGSQWVQDAKAAIPEDTKAAHVNEEIAAYAVEAHVNGQKLPSTLQRWVNSFLSAIRSAIIQRMQDGKLKMWAIKNLQAEDLARLAIAGLKAKAAGQLQGQSRLAESVMFSLKRAFSGKHKEKQFIVPETGAYLKDQSLIDLAYLDGKPIRLQVGNHSKKFGIMHLLGNAADDSRRGYESVTDDDAENAVRGLIDLLRRKDLQLHGDTDPILRSAFSKRSIVLNDVGPFYTVTTVRPGEANKWGTGNRIAAGRLTFPVDAELGTATSEMGRTGDKGQAPAPSGREVISTKFNPNEIGKERQVKVTVKKARVLVREDAGSAVQSTTSASEGVVNTSETSGGQSVTNVSDNDGERKYSKINQTATDAFKKWFGDSKVVDAERKPLVVYHGTGSDFESFDRATVGAAIDSGKLGEGFYFSQSHKWAGAYADNAARRNGGSASVMPVYLSIKNPVILDGPGNVWGKLERVSNDWGIESRPVIDDLNTPNPEWSKAFTAEAERRGFDGVILPLKFGESEFVAFRPDQIKSATGNNGDFAENNPDIRYSKSKIIGDSGRSYDQSERDFFKNVGREINPETRVEKTLGYLKNDFWKKMAVGIVDQFRGLRDLNDSGQSYMLARLSKGTAGAFDALLHHGKLSIKDGVYDADTSGGFIEKLGSPLNGELDDVLWWIAANRAEKLTAEGKENLFSAQDIAAGKGLSKGNTNFDYTIQTGPGKGKVTRNRAMIYADANRIFNDFQKNTLDIAEQSGLIDGSVRKFWESEFYVPFYRVSEEDGEFIGSKMGNALVRQQAFKKLKGGTDKLNSDLLSNTLMNWSHLIEASAKNRAAKAALTASEKVGAAQPVAANMGEYSAANGKMLPPGTKKTVWFMDGGQKKEYLVTDPFVMTAITSLEYAGMRNGVMDVLTKFKHYLTVGVTASPAFKVRNLIRDSIQAIGTSDLGYNPIKNVVEGFKQTKRDSQEYVSALASGGLIRFGTMLEGSESARTRQLIRNGVKDSTILNSEGKWKDFFNQYIEPGIEAYNEIGNRSEEINRAALYNQLIKQGKSHAEAALMARDLMDFSMQGSFNTIRFLSQVTPFFNARLQGMYKLGRAAKEDPAKMAIVTGAVALAGMSLMLAYGDDEDWKKREDWDLNQYFWFKIGDTAFRIPRPFEIGAVASLAERGLQYMIDDEMTGERFRKVVGHLLMDNLSMNPTPQAIKPIVDLYANRDSFTGRPIETMAMEKVDPTERYTSNTSMVARGASKALAGAASPVQIDHLARSYFGWLGAFVVGGADMAARAMSDEPTKPTLDYFKFATQGIVSESNSPSSRYVTNIYDQAKELEQAYGTWRRMLKEGKIEDAKQYAEDNRDKLSRYKSVESVKKVEAKFSERIRQIERSSLDPDEKKAQIANVNRMKDFAARRLTPGYSAQ